MASNTPNINLYKKNPVTDGNDTFNINTMLNENWDKIDKSIGDYRTPAQKLGLTGDLSVGASLGVLADVGNLYVWKKINHKYEYLVKELSEDEHKNASVKLSYGTTPATVYTGDSIICVQGDHPGVPKLALSGQRLLDINNINPRLLSGTIVMKNPKSPDTITSLNAYYNIDISVTTLGKNVNNDARAAYYGMPNQHYYYPSVVDLDGSTSYVVSTNRHAYPDSGGTETEEYEYVGRVGDNHPVEIVSYVGTGLYGPDNPCSVTASFPIKYAWLFPMRGTKRGSGNDEYIEYNAMYTFSDTCNGCFVNMRSLSETFERYTGLGNIGIKFVDTMFGKRIGATTIQWYNTNSSQSQANSFNTSYYVVLFG